MKQRPAFPARLDLTLAKTSPHSVGVPLVGQNGKNVQRVPGLAARSVALPAVVRQATMGYGMESQALRERMVQRLQAQGIKDQQVLQAMQAVERHRFVDSALINQAYEDTSLPIGLGQTISKPSVVSRMLELLRNGQTGLLGRVLEIGTGCGYQAVVLSKLATEVYSIERLRGLHDKARENLRPMRLPNIHLLFGDGMLAFPKGAPYAGIIAAAGGDAVPQAWVDQLAVGGRLVAPVVTKGTSSTVVGSQALLVLDKTATGVRQTILETVHFVPLKSGIA